jgi:hypothetical protein
MRSERHGERRLADGHEHRSSVRKRWQMTQQHMRGDGGACI